MSADSAGATVRVSVVIPLKRVNPYLEECLAHLRAQTYRAFDVYVVTDDPETLPVEGLRVHFLASGPVPPNVKRMLAGQHSKAEILAFIDDDAYPLPRWLENAVRHFDTPSVVGVGGPGMTPPMDAAMQQASGAVYASALVSGGYTYRFLPAALRTVDDYPSCNLLLRREPFLRHVPACIRYWPGEDTKLCLALTRDEGGTIVYDPEVRVFHHRRPLFWQHFRQVWSYAVHRGFFSKRYPETSLRPAYFVPSVFVVANLALLLAWPWNPVVRQLAPYLVSIYAAVVALASLAAIRSHRANPLAVAVGIYFTHMTYGTGFLVGLTRKELKR
ncbi:MAG: glycosyltransferase [Vulcanimicrobiaceae bacterium]